MSDPRPANGGCQSIPVTISGQVAETTIGSEATSGHGHRHSRI